MLCRYGDDVYIERCPLNGRTKRPADDQEGRRNENSVGLLARGVELPSKLLKVINRFCRAWAAATIAAAAIAIAIATAATCCSPKT